MAIDFKLPSLGENIDAGDIVSVLVQEGDMIQANQNVFEVETGKATVELPCPHAGKITKIHVKQGQSVPVGEVLLSLDAAAAEAAPAKPAAKPAAPAEAKPAAAPAKAAAPKPAPEPPAPAPAACFLQWRRPGIRRDGRHGSSGRNGPSRSGDATIARKSWASIWPASTAPAPAVGSRKKTLRRRSANRRPSRPPRKSRSRFRMRRPVKTLGVRCRFSGCREFARRSPSTWPARHRPFRTSPISTTSTSPSWNSFAKAASAEFGRRRHQVDHDRVRDEGRRRSALQLHPVVNATLDMENDQVIYKDYVNLGVAVDTDRGLVVPVLREVNRMTIPQIAQSLAEISVKARDNQFGLDDMRGGTFTISNLGAIGGTYSTPIINPPEVAILLVGRSRKLPVIGDDDEIKARLMMPLSLSYDHRLIDGAAAARFLNEVKNFLQVPGRLLLAN